MARNVSEQLRSRTIDLFAILYAMGILVTGGAGFIGGHTLRELIARHPTKKIYCLDDLSTGYKTNIPSGVTFIEGDVTDQTLVSELVAECADGIIHLAADSRVLPSLKSPELARKSVETNISGTLSVLTAISKTGKSIPFVYAGSSTAYGDQPPPQRETDLPRVQSPYSAGKLAGELIIRSFVVTFGIRATTLRYFQVYGPGQPSTGNYALVTGIFLQQFKEKTPLTIEGDGSQSRDFVHVKDVARANVDALLKDTHGFPVNIGSGKSHSIKFLADFISKDQIYKPARKIDLPATHADITLAKEFLGWEPQITLEQGISELMKADA